MTCQNCGHENVSEARFCASCGNPLASYGVQPDLRQTKQVPGDLQPRDLGDLLTETYNVYKRNFWVFLVIATMPQGPLLVASVSSGTGSLLFSLLGFLLIPLAAGATIYAVVQQHLSKVLTVGECFRYSFQMVVMLTLAYILVTLALIASAFLSLILVGIPLIFYLLVIWFFALHAIIIEGKSPISALRRSNDLVKGSWWRVFGIGVVFVLVMIGLFLVALIPVGILTFLTPVLGSVFFAVISTVLFPITYIAGTLIYIDLRVRKEGYNLDMMALEVRQPIRS